MLAYNVCFMFNFFFQDQVVGFKKLNSKISQICKDLLTFEGYLFTSLTVLYLDLSIYFKIFKLHLYSHFLSFLFFCKTKKNYQTFSIEI